MINVLCTVTIDRSNRYNWLILTDAIAIEKTSAPYVNRVNLVFVGNSPYNNKPCKYVTQIDDIEIANKFIVDAMKNGHIDLRDYETEKEYIKERY